MVRAIHKKEVKKRTATELTEPEARSMSISSVKQAWRYVVVFLLEVADYTLKEVSSVVGKKIMECAKWANRFWDTGSVEDAERSGRESKVDAKDLKAIKEEFSTSLPGISLKVVLKRLQESGKISKDVSEDSFRNALNNDGWGFQKVNHTLPLSDDHKDDRWAFAVKYRNVGLGYRAIFTDSKYFTGGQIEPRSKKQGFHAWAPDGEPRTVFKTQGSVQQVHAYGGVCKHGLTELTIVSGSNGLDDAYKVDRKNPRYKEGSVDADEKEKVISTLTGNVAHQEYRDIIMGGGPRKYNGLLSQAKVMFEKAGEKAWWWQQDGAPSHSIHDTLIGNETRRLIKSIAPNIVEWPATSPDLSPIENVWQHVEHVLWRDYTWHTQQEFQDSLLKAWKDVSNDKMFIKNIMASVDRRSKDGDKGGRIAQLLASKGDQTTY